MFDICSEVEKMMTNQEDTHRPCYIDGVKAMFHRFSERSEIIVPSPLAGGHSGGVLRWTVAIVEYENGTVSEVAAIKVRFADGGNFSSTEFIPLDMLGGAENE